MRKEEKGGREEKTHLSNVILNDRVSSVGLVDLNLSLSGHVVEAECIHEEEGDW